MSNMASENHTSSKRVSNSDKVSWTNYDGTKPSHEVQAKQMNLKTSDGDHYFYCPKSGASGVALANAERTGQSKSNGSNKSNDSSKSSNSNNSKK